MIAWLNPAALWGLAAVAGAVLVHLLFRQRSVRVPFPSLRFIRSSSVAAVRLRRPSDLVLLAVRAAILALAAAALAQPLVATASRSRAWNARIARAIVVDTSDSMREGSVAAADAVRVEAQTAAASVRIDTRDIARGIRQGIAWLATAPPARREIVVVSDFQRGAVFGKDLENVPHTVGVRLVKVGALPPSREFVSTPRFDGDAVATSRVRLAGGATSVVIGTTSEVVTGLELVALPGSDESLRSLRRVVAAAGAPAPAAGEPIAICLGGLRVSAPLQPIARAWMLQTMLAMRQDQDLLALGEPRATARDERPWVTVLQDRDGRPLVRAAAAGERLVIDVAAPPTQLLSAAAVRAALIARGAAASLQDHEVLALPDDEIARWLREAPPVAGDAWRHAEPSDARLCWALALLLLGAEWILRGRRVTEREVQANAA